MPASIPSSTICIDVPPGVSFSTITAIANATDIKVLPTAGKPFIDAPKFELQRQAYHLLGPHSFVVLDMSRLKSYGMHLVDLARSIESPNLRKRFFLTHVAGQVTQSDAHLAQTLGFSHLVSDLNPRHIVGNVSKMTDWICTSRKLAPESLNRLPTYLKTVPLANAKEGNRELIQRLTGSDVETLIEKMSTGLDISDRTYRLKKYRLCFLGNEATAWLQKRYKTTESQALAIGNALHQLGLLYHAAHEQPFANEAFFYRLATSKVVDGIPMQKLLHGITVNKGVEVSDRSYLGKTFEQCFIGSEAVDHIVKKWSIDRLDAWVALHRLEQLGFFEHVTQEHSFVDGNFFYRFK
jgi:hypothetical protein